MKTTIRKSRGRGYTLIELTLAMSVGIVISALVMSLVNQQLAFLRIFRAQSFLVTEAPMLNNYLVKVVGNADSYRLYASVEDLVAGRAQVMENAPVIMLRFKEPNGTFRASVLSFENPGTGSGLYYRMVNTSGVLGSPSWSLSKRPTNVRFSIEQGILRVRVSGPNGEEVIYSGAMQL
ncbi:type II secretion system GspH family protein [Luteolibacter arcticus]|uniref:Type II secretion system GspH family protein n=1 Tax=Luteolibacter arcticus TaxID=1581411 RepID=A0ABT3GDC5_9BACT|nr:type II secretion system protein [Luteolibacter arcticus]MCW1921631.1 type II secretion system GspH family protein [Luteolibacter arcticus]